MYAIFPKLMHTLGRIFIFPLRRHIYVTQGSSSPLIAGTRQCRKVWILWTSPRGSCCLMVAAATKTGKIGWATAQLISKLTQLSISLCQYLMSCQSGDVVQRVPGHQEAWAGNPAYWSQFLLNPFDNDIDGHHDITIHIIDAFGHVTSGLFPIPRAIFRHKWLLWWTVVLNKRNLKGVDLGV